MRRDRLDNYRRLEEIRGSRLLVYVTGDRPGLETQIHSEVLDYFTYHLDLIGDVEKISLYIYTRGGDTLAAWSIANLIRQFCKSLEVIIPAKCHSAGTLISLAADTIVMTKQATLGPIDPSVHGPLNPGVPGAPPNVRVPVSVEAINGYLEFVREALGNEASIHEIIRQLSRQIHPLVLGDVYRARAQIRMLARKLLGRQIEDTERLDRILEFLCSESGSHDYTINRQEARDDLGLNIEKPNDQLYQVIKSIYDDIATELELTTPFHPALLLGTNQSANYTLRRALIESIKGGTHVFVSEGIFTRQRLTNQFGIPQEVIADQRTFEGWRHETS